MRVILITTFAVVVLFGLAGTASAEFQVFTDEASYQAALAAGGAGSQVQADESAVSAFSDHGGTIYSGPSLTFNSFSNLFVAVSGFFNFLTGGTVDVSLDGSYADSTSTSGFFGIISWSGFQTISFESNTTTSWQVSDVDMAYDTVAPEPTSLALFGMGALGLIGVGGRRRRKPRESVA